MSDRKNKIFSIGSTTAPSMHGFLARKSAFIFLAIVIMAFFAYSSPVLAADGSELSISFLNQDPDPAEPGNFFKARFKVENIGLDSANNVEIEILPEYPFSIYQDSTVKKISSISPRQKDNEAVFIDYTLKADENAIPGSNEIKMRYRIGNGEWVKTEPWTINLREYTVLVALDSVIAEPQVVSPGESVKLKLRFTNLANTQAKYLDIKLGLVSVLSSSTSFSVTELPFSPAGGTNEIIFPLLKARESQTAEFNLVTDANAESKVYKIPVTYSYTDPTNTNYSKINYISLKFGQTPELVTTLDSTTLYQAGTTGEVIVKFVNKGINDVKFLYAKLKPSDDFDLISSPDMYVGNIDSDDYESVNYKLYIKPEANGKVILPLSIQYKDDNNKNYQTDVSLELTLFNKEEAIRMGLEKRNNLWVYAVVLLVLVAAFLLYRNFRKRK